MTTTYKPKETSAIINALSGGVVPSIGIQHITVGRSKEVEAIMKSLSDVESGNSVVRFWIGDFGSGKSFILNLIKNVALKKNFVVAMADFTPETRLYSSDRKAVAMYTKIIDSLSIQVKQEGNALPTILEKWIEKVMVDVAEKNNFSLSDVKIEKNRILIENEIIRITNEISEIGGYDFGIVISKYFSGYITENSILMKYALRWLRAEYTAKTDARIDLGIREIINDSNYYDMLKNFSKFFKILGYSGFVINLDEAVNLYKISQSEMRNKNYEKILAIYNDCLQGKISGIFLNFGGTQDFLMNERRGLYSYQALKTRLEGNKFETNELRDYSQPVLKLIPLTHDEIFVLLTKLKEIYNFNYQINIDLTNEEIRKFMESIWNKLGSEELLTPREVIKEFINIMSIIRQNPSTSKEALFQQIELEKAEILDEKIDNIEII
ncbi:MAG: ATP-binding protein [bacterium]